MTLNIDQGHSLATAQFNRPLCISGS